LNILFVGDIVGNPGRKISKEVIPTLIKEYDIDFCIANGENAAGGSGITYSAAQELYRTGVDIITLGNHTWSKREITNFIDSDKKLIRPANYPAETPGRGSAVIEKNGLKIGVINVQGRVYMDNIDCPFKAAVKELEYLKSFVKVIVVDMHAEATSEKAALAWYLDGRVSCVFGTHTHVQTSDERILPFGTSFITDAGMTGPYEGILGVNRHIIIERFLTNMPARFEIAKGKVQFNGIIADIDDVTGKTRQLKRISKVSKL
jgi:metallophosphoesterase (TIGR00282 family)